MSGPKKKHLDFDLILVPFIDLLSVCICFLLITAVWLNIGTMNVKQAVGGQPVAETVKKPLLWVLLGQKGQVTLEAQETRSVPQSLRKLKLNGVEGRLNLPELGKMISAMRAVEPNLRTALIQPQAQSSYEEIIDLMDQIKKSGLTDLGVAPL